MTALDLIIKGDLVLPDRVIRNGWLGVAGQRIVDIYSEAPTIQAARTLDHSGHLILPGGIDPHVHAYSAGPNFEGLGRLTRGAAAGGITTIIDMPYDAPKPLAHVDQLPEKVQRISAEAVVNVALYGTIRKHDGTDQIGPLSAAGISVFKFSTYESDPARFPKIPDDELIKAFMELQEVDRVAVFHAENGDIIDPLIASLYDRGEASPEAHCWSRPPLSETTAVLHLLELVRVYPVKLHIAHLTVPFAYDAIAWYRELGVDVSAETCIQYLVLDESHLNSLRGVAKCNPPLRTKAIQDELWARLKAGEIAFVVSDHAPWPDADKAAPNIFDNKSGLPGVEQLLPLLYSEGVVKRGLELTHFADLIAGAAARRFGLAPQKGQLAIGADADITVLDPDQEWIVRGRESQSAAKLSPYEGMHVNGRVVKTIVRGAEVFANGEVVAQPGAGQFVRHAA
jgi:allantoinase